MGQFIPQPGTDVKIGLQDNARRQRQFMKDLGFRGIGQADALPMPRLGSDLITSPAADTQRLVQRG